MLPSSQHRYDSLPELSEGVLYRRRETTFLILSGIFLGTLAMLNILGITRFITLYEVTDSAGETAEWRGVPLVFAVAIGVLPYPITFLCTDFISELYGRARANRVVWVGFILNLWVMFILWIGGVLPGSDSEVFTSVRTLAFGAVTASMIAYLVAQLIDVHVFHFWKKLTKGKHLWLRNNGSTLVSQLVDTTAVILITHFYADALKPSPDHALWPQLLLFIATGYVFKALVALVDTVPFYLGAPRLAKFLRVPPPDALPSTSGAAAVEAGVG